MFSWDNVKNAANRRKHGISFEAALLVFDDPHHVTRMDRIENGERRWQTIGAAGDVVLMLVAHTWHETETGEEHIRIISARRASRQERNIYEQDNHP